MKRFVLASAVICAALVFLVLLIIRFDSLACEKVRLEVNGEVTKPLVISHCYNGNLRSYCIDTKRPEEFNFEDATIQLDGDTVVTIKAPWYFNEEELLIEDLNGGIFEFVVTTKNNTIPFAIYIE